MSKAKDENISNLNEIEKPVFKSSLQKLLSCNLTTGLPQVAEINALDQKKTTQILTAASGEGLKKDASNSKKLLTKGALTSHNVSKKGDIDIITGRLTASN